jgi:hypothetical protein
MIRKVIRLLFLVYVPSAIIWSCGKEVLYEDPSARLVFSADTVLFDTIFTSTGSATKHFKVFNPYDRSLKISEIYLAGGADSPYRINVDGIPGKVFNDIVLRGGDSLFVFVETTIDPLDADTPLIVEDSLVFKTSGNIQKVNFVSWGQDVNIIMGETFTTGTLQAGKPYLVYDFLVIDAGHVLTLEPGVRIHFHQGARMDVAGTIIAEGTYEQPVVFEGARTETANRNIPGQWEGIRLMPGSKNNRFINARVRNAVTGILVDTLSGTDDDMLYLANTRIENMTYAGLFSRASQIYSYNSIISNCGYHGIRLSQGGDYTFYHCTVANYWRFSIRNTSSVYIDNYQDEVAANNHFKPLSVKFGNSIIHGSNSNEVEFTAYQDAGSDVVFSHCLISIQNPVYRTYPWLFENCIRDAGPGFVDEQGFNFRLDEGSRAIKSGDPDIGMMHPLDFEGRSRVTGKAPDMGAFESSFEEL